MCGVVFPPKHDRLVIGQLVVFLESHISSPLYQQLDDVPLVAGQIVKKIGFGLGFLGGVEGVRAHDAGHRLQAVNGLHSGYLLSQFL